MRKLSRSRLAAWWWVLAGGMASVGWPSASAQAIDPSNARAVLGEPLSIEVRVRAPTEGPDLTARCVDAEFEWDGIYLSPDEVRVSLEAEQHTGWILARLSHPRRVSEPLITTRVMLRCGAHFAREFPVLADPPEPGRRPATTPQRKSPRPTDSNPRGSLTAASFAGPTVIPTPPSSVPTVATNRPQQSGLPPIPWRDRSNPEPPASSTSSNKFVVDELIRQSAQINDVRQSINAVLSQQSRRDRDTLGPWWSASAVILGIALVGLLRIGSDSWRMHQPALRRFGRRPSRQTTNRPLSAPEPPDPEVPPASTPTSPLPDRVPQQPLGGHEARWADADFGRAALGDAPAPEFLREVEGLIAQGYPAGALVMLEKALQAGPDKNPWLLLMLLDLYGEMGQPWNQARVAAQLEALYNVRIPLQGGDAPEGSPLEEHARTLRHIAQHWSTVDARDALARVLLQPPELEPLSLAAFRTALLLHAMAAHPNDDPPAFDPLIDWSPTPPNA